ncbi:DNA/RNA non-specific endonuclease [Lentilactobacillus sp. Marseille-Q4993]|uniref:DNA/RNA non-specific endonuclease n=1 Tax=Lentilactobacillus sp. Marseille-Q4993 TaxID=3039492 RepID=UPI0024BC1955|nr:DNA/RNA non-specific endonuclease [Lentilactobacillus sp. Marseille-Q4993]
MGKLRKFFLTLILVVGLVGGSAAIIEPTTTSAATAVYITRTGKHYFYHRHNRGLNRAKKVFRVSLAIARRRGLTLAKTDYRTARKVVRRVKRSTVHKAQASHPTVSKSKYHGKLITLVNGNRPTFTSSDLSTANGPWQYYGNLDGYNRPTLAKALLNERLMPSATREALYVNPTGWHNKRTSSGWLYNRCHLIGYQLTGQNNNPKNLITGTRELNDPGMLKYENEIASYLRSNSHHYVRYSVAPDFKGGNLLASGVHMQAKSVGSNSVSFNVYVHNIEPGYSLNYATGTSVKK